LGVSEPTYHRWKQEYGGMKGSDAKGLKELEKENQRLKRLVAEQALDLLMLSGPLFPHRPFLDIVDRRFRRTNRRRPATTRRRTCECQRR
jgi:hypothetical protein